MKQTRRSFFKYFSVFGFSLHISKSFGDIFQEEIKSPIEKNRFSVGDIVYHSCENDRIGFKKTNELVLYASKQIIKNTKFKKIINKYGESEYVLRYILCKPNLTQTHEVWPESVFKTPKEAFKVQDEYTKRFIEKNGRKNWLAQAKTIYKID